MEIVGLLTDGLVRTREERKYHDLLQRAKKVEKTEKEGRKGSKQTFQKDNRQFFANCKTFGKRHMGPCNQDKTCTFCMKKGHVVEECLEKKQKEGVCFHCNEPEHVKRNCPKLDMNRGGNLAGGSGIKNDQPIKKNVRTFVLNAQEAIHQPDKITGTFLINNAYAKVLFDSGANLSFIDLKFCSMLNIPLVRLNQVYEVETASGEIVRISERLENCYITLSQTNVHVQLLPMSLSGFDVVLGMDWLAANQARIKCNTKIIELSNPMGKKLLFKTIKFLNPLASFLH